MIVYLFFFLFTAERHLYFYVPLRTWREESNYIFIAKNHLTCQDQVPKRLHKIIFFCILEVYLAIAPAPVNEVVLDSEDTFLSEMSSQRDWPLRTTWAGVTSMHIKADNFCQRYRKGIAVCHKTLVWEFSPDLLYPFSMTASSSSGALLDKRCLFKRDFSL